ncbi:MAG: methyltransferase domain-containing protein [Methylococcaceae bacterium]|nr:methyltransferase domain-containing protein [Methylococcaceae bacterium]
METIIKQRLNQVYNAESTEKLETAYDDWADDFDRDSEQRGGRQPALVSNLVMRHVKKTNEPILDAGVGTGLLGEFLQIFDYSNLVGIDFSEAMLKVADRKNIYNDLQRMTLGETLDFPDDYFKVVISAGVFTTGHAPANSLDELVRVTQKNGYLIFSVNDKVYANEFAIKQQTLENQSLWRLVESTEPCQIMPRLHPEAKARLFVYQVC